jgi:hypothetical protein
MNDIEKRLKDISKYIDNIKKTAYKDVYNIENQVLNKNPYTSEFINKYLFNKTSGKLSFFLFIKSISFYLLRKKYQLL